MTLRQDFRERPVFTLVGFALLINFCVSLCVDSESAQFAVLTPDAAHTYGIRHRGGITYFFTPFVGTYLTTSFFGHLVGVGVMGLMQWRFSRRPTV